MKRRDLLAGFLAGAGFAAANGYLWQRALSVEEMPADDIGLASSGRAPVGIIEPDLVHVELSDAEGIPANIKAEDKVRFFESEFVGDIFLADAERPLLHSVLLRLERAQRTTGHGNFNVLGFDDLLKVARNYSSVGAFTQSEVDFMEQLFVTRASQYGFLGDKVVDNLTSTINSNDTVKIQHSGNYLFKGRSLVHYQKLRELIGPSIILTSGIRSNVKQIHLFLAKTANSGYNLSKASRSLAPPGYSYHGIGDYDVGKVGFGSGNFTDSFAATDEFKRMQDLGYIEIRYTRDNRLGVRFEPWHIKVV